MLYKQLKETRIYSIMGPPFDYGEAFPTGWDSATFRDKGTEVPSLSWDKGTTGQS